MKQLIVFLLILFLSSASADDNEECAIYLAESSINNAGWGVFAGKDYKNGDKIGEPGLGVHITGSHKIHDAGALHEFIK